MLLTFLFIVSFISISFCIYVIFIPKTEEEKEYERKQKEFLDDGLLTDPETGAKITLEQAESGHWIQHDNEYSTVPESEIEKLYTEEQKNAERAVNYLKQSRVYKKYKFDDKEIDFLEKSNILSKYDNWSYSNSFKIENNKGFVFLPAIKYDDNGVGYFSNEYEESQLMFWIKLDNDFGHYYLREKENVEKFFDLIRKDDDLDLKNYEVFTVKKTMNIVPLINILKHFEKQKELEIEVIESNLLIKNTKYINLVDIQRIEEVIKNVC